MSEVAFDTPETDDLVVAIELMDSFDPLRLRSKSEGASEGRRGGRAGDGFPDGLLGGKAGPADNCDDCVVVLAGRGGRAAPLLPFTIWPFVAPASGKFPIERFADGA